MPQQSSLVAQARALAHRAHATQVRKASGVPYYAHLDGVAEILESCGHNEDRVIAAAYLHDLFEDQPQFSEELRQIMPHEVVDIVTALTEQKLDAAGRKRPKSERFAGYLAGLKSGSPAALKAIPISCADKIHNLRSIVEDEVAGRSPLMIFTTRPGELTTQLGQLRTVYEPIVKGELLAAYDAACQDFRSTIERWLPGRAALIAAQAHLGQYDKGGHPYILHPMRLAVAATTSQERVVALLHDVIEDSSWTLQELEREGFPAEVLRALDALTRREGEDYASFIERIARHRLATRVKLLDLRDNSDLSRLTEVTDAARQRLARYQMSIQRLEIELEKRSLYITLDAESRERLLPLCTRPILKADHVTLAYRQLPNEFRKEWIPGGHALGAEVSMRAVTYHQNSALDAVTIEMAGSTTRPQDGRILHVTLSHHEGVSPRDANELVADTVGTPISIELRGRVVWVDE